MQLGFLLLLYAITIGAGASVAFQQVLNANLRVQLGSPWLAGFTSYFVGMIAMLIVSVAVDGPRAPTTIVGRVHGLTWTGGCLGAIFIATAILMVPRLGAATTLAFIVVGQLLASVLIDHFGLLGVPQHPVSLVRITGIVMLVGGVALVKR